MSSDVVDRQGQIEATGFEDESSNTDRSSPGHGPLPPSQKTLIHQILLELLQNSHFQSATLLQFVELLRARQHQELMLDQQQRQNRGGSSASASHLLGPLTHVPDTTTNSFNQTTFRNVNRSASDLNNTANETPLNSEIGMHPVSISHASTTNNTITNVAPNQQRRQDTTVNISNLDAEQDMTSNLQMQAPVAGRAAANISETTSDLAHSSLSSPREMENVSMTQDNLFKFSLKSTSCDETSQPIKED